VNINPRPIAGPWSHGFTLDQHTISAEFLGYDLHERPMFDTVRSEVGELLFRCKYRGDLVASAELARVAAEFLRAEGIAPDVVVAVPPSRARPFQPLAHIANGLAAWLGVPFDRASLRKVKDTPELKSMADMELRAALLADAFTVEGNALDGKAVLLLDDLYRSGASMTVAARAVTDAGRAASVFALALTRTRSRT
jgi:competence protein ComFC